MPTKTDRLDELLRALANPARRKILQIVWTERMSAGEISDRLELAKASVSEHLKILRKAELVTVEKDATWWFYQAKQSAIGELNKLITQTYKQGKK